MNNYDLGKYLYELLPHTYKVGDETTDYTLRRYIEALNGGFGTVMREAQEIVNLIDVERVPERFLPYIANMCGIEFDNDIDTDLQRKILVNIVDIYKRKGTKEVIKFVAREITGIDADAREGHHFVFRTWGTNPHDEMLGNYSTPKTFSSTQNYVYYLGGDEKTSRFTTYVTLFTDQDVDDVDIKEELIRRFTKGLIPSYINLVFRLRGASIEEEVIYPVLTEEYRDIENFGEVRKSNIQYTDDYAILKTKDDDTVLRLNITENHSDSNINLTEIEYIPLNIWDIDTMLINEDVIDEQVLSSISYEHTDNIIDQNVSVIGVSLNKNELSLDVNTKETLIATINPQNATNTNVSWQSNAPSIAGVSYLGEVSAHSVGTAIITVTTEDGAKTDTCTVTVTETQINTPVSSITISETNKTVMLGESFSLTYTIYPINATNTRVTWSSSEPSVAHVSNSGYVTTLGQGNTTITVTTEDGNKTASCYLTVEIENNTEDTPPSGNNNTVLDMQYANQHECIPNCPESIDWKYKPRLGHGMTIPRSYIDNTPWKAFGQWLTVYNENGKTLVENVGVELTDFKMWRYDINTNQWKLINEGFDYGAFYLEDFWDDGNAPLPNNKVLSSDKRTYKCLMNSATSGRCFHPFSPQIDWSSVGFDYVTGPCYVVSQVKFRLIKWDESGVDNRAKAHLCVDVGGDYWIYKGATFDSQWRHNGDFAIGNYIKATSDWKYAYATSCPQSWDKGFPVDY